MAGYVDYRVFKMYNLNNIQRSTYITRGINNKYVTKLNNTQKLDKIDNKIYFNTNFNEFLGREWINLNNITVKEFGDFFKRHKDIIVKVVDGTCGKGVDKYTYKEDINIEELYNLLKQNGQVLIEECVKQHDKLQELSPNSVNTVRVVTIRKEGKVYIPFVGLRIGNGKHVDNFNSGGLLAVVNDDGKITKPAIDKAGNIYTKHPITNVDIIGFEIPNFERVKEVAKKCAMKVEDANYVGLDVVATNEGAVILELNPFPGHDLYQSEVHLDEDKIGLKPKFDEII